MNDNPNNPSRRAFSQRLAAYALGIAVVLCSKSGLAAAQRKLAQHAVKYQDKPKDKQQCDKCALFEPPDACKSVEGKISAQGWCTIFAAKD